LPDTHPANLPGARTITDPEAEMRRMAAARGGGKDEPQSDPEDDGKTLVLAIIRDVRCGVDDHGACLRFTTCISESSRALQVLPWDRAKTVIEAYGVSDVGQLNGKACWIDVSKPGLAVFAGPAKL
jgi:hypothetical protein